MQIAFPHKEGGLQKLQSPETRATGGREVFFFFFLSISLGASPWPPGYWEAGLLNLRASHCTKTTGLRGDRLLHPGPLRGDLSV